MPVQAVLASPDWTTLADLLPQLDVALDRLCYVVGDNAISGAQHLRQAYRTAAVRA
jgi:hypothetical protein